MRITAEAQRYPHHHIVQKETPRLSTLPISCVKNKPSRQASPVLGEQPTTITTILTIRFQAARKPLQNHTSIHLTDRSCWRRTPNPKLGSIASRQTQIAPCKTRTGKELQLERKKCTDFKRLLCFQRGWW